MDGAIREVQDGVTSQARKKPRSSLTGSGGGRGGVPGGTAPRLTVRGAQGEHAGALEPLPGYPGGHGRGRHPPA